MWSVDEQASPAWTADPIEPDEVLYEFDGPLTFTARIGFFNALFHKIGVRSFAHFFLVSEVNDVVVDALRDGRLSVLGALKSDRLWIIEAGPNLQVKRFWATSFDEVPHQLMPQRHTPIYSYQQLCLDSIEQTKSFFSMSFDGAALKRQGTPFTLFKNIVNNSHEAARRFLSPVFMAGAKSVTYDFPARALPGSLLLLLDKPVINASLLRQRTRRAPISLESAQEYYEQQKALFFDEVSELVDDARKGEIGDAIAGERFALLDNLKHIIPSESSSVEEIEFAGTYQLSVRSLTIDEDAGSKLRRAFKRIETQPITETGRVEIVNSPSKYFTYRSSRGKQVACHISDTHFDELVAEGNLVTGASVRVNGRLQRRPRRDIINSDIKPELWIETPAQASSKIVFVEAQPQGYEGGPIVEYLVEDGRGTVLQRFATQAQAIEWAKRTGRQPYVARVRHLNDRAQPDHWRKA